jgi:PGM1 C-terminal domain
MSDAFATLQSKLGPAMAANRPGSATSHVLIALPSYSVSESLMSHYSDRIAVLEHRYLNAVVIAGRIESCEMIYVSTRAPLPEVIEYYLELLPPERRASTGQRIRVIEVPDDGTARSVAARMVDRPDLIALVREHIGDRPAVIEPWNVTEHEVNLALALDVPINGSAPELRALAFKGAGRRLFATAGVPAPLGREEVRTTDDVVRAVQHIGRQRPLLGGVVIKHDDSGAGDGNVVLDLRRMHHVEDPEAWLRATVDDLPTWYRNDLMLGGVVEERIAGERFSSPSAQVDIRPDGAVVVLATHEQVLGGEGGQVYLGCRFPADPAYAPVLAEHAAKVGAELARHGARGRFSVDFVTAAGPTPEGAEPAWDVYAIEINLRKGGTTHPYAALRNLVPGRYDTAAGRWLTDDGETRAYTSTDNLVDERWLGLLPGEVIRAVREAGLQFDSATRAGTVLHMLAGLGVDGRIGVTAIAPTPAEADAMYDAVRVAIDAIDVPTDVRLSRV